MLKETIRQLCLSRNISFMKLESDLNFGSGSISKWDKVSPKAENLEKVADYFGVTVDYLLGREPQRTPEDIVAQFADQESILKAFDLFSQMDEAHQKAALAQLEALVALNKK